MRSTFFRVGLLLACVVAANCGGGSPTSPDDPSNPSPPIGGGPGGGGSTGNTSVYSDSAFSDNDWDTELQVFGAGGTGSAGHLSFNGQAGADYRRIVISVNDASGASAAQVAVFSIKRGTSYFPSSDGRIFTVDYSEDSIMLSGGGNGQYSAPALKQNGKLYTLVPGGRAFATPDAVWTPHSLTGLTQNDFRTLASDSDHPDFSAAGARIDWGFMRLHSVASGNNGETRTGGIDNLRITLYR